MLFDTNNNNNNNNNNNIKIISNIYDKIYSVVNNNSTYRYEKRIL